MPRPLRHANHRSSRSSSLPPAQRSSALVGAPVPVSCVPPGRGEGASCRRPPLSGRQQSAVLSQSAGSKDGMSGSLRVTWDRLWLSPTSTRLCRMGLAGQGRLGQAEHQQDAQRREPGGPRPDPHPDHRCLGARLRESQAQRHQTVQLQLQHARLRDAQFASLQKGQRTCGLTS